MCSFELLRTMSFRAIFRFEILSSTVLDIQKIAYNVKPKKIIYFANSLDSEAPFFLWV